MPPEPVPPGHLRQASGEDGPMVTRWVTDFLAVMSEQRGPVEAAPERLRSGSLFVWDNDGPVSMAGWTGKTLNGVRVTFVYTPPEFRRHGYASACVAALTQRLLDEGIGIAASTPTWRIPPPTASTNRSAIVRCVTSLTMRSPSNQVLEP